MAHTTTKKNYLAFEIRRRTSTTPIQTRRRLAGLILSLTFRQSLHNVHLLNSIFIPQAQVTALPSIDPIFYFCVPRVPAPAFLRLRKSLFKQQGANSSLLFGISRLIKAISLSLFPKKSQRFFDTIGNEYIKALNEPTIIRAHTGKRE